MATVNSSVIGVNLGNSDGATALFKATQHVLGDSSSEWIYVQANVALTTGMMVAVSGTLAFPCSLGNALNPLLATALPLAFAQGNFAAADYGWVAMRGSPLVVLLSTSSTLGAPLYVGGSNAGSLSSAVANSGTMAGIAFITVSATTSYNAVNSAYISWPRTSAAAIAGGL